MISKISRFFFFFSLRLPISCCRKMMVRVMCGRPRCRDQLYYSSIGGSAIVAGRHQTTDGNLRRCSNRRIRCRVSWTRKNKLRERQEKNILKYTYLPTSSGNCSSPSSSASLPESSTGDTLWLGRPRRV